MLIRLGYAVNCKTLEENHLYHTLTYTNYIKSNDNLKLTNVINANLEGFKEILKYNAKNNIHFYRLNSSLIPLATHELVKYDYLSQIKEQLKELGEYIKEYNMRIDTHPDQFCVLNSTKSSVVKNSIKILEYEKDILNNPGISNPRIILHVGSSEISKSEGIKRFISNFNKLDQNLKNMIVLENDDKVYDIKDTLKLCQYLKIPMVLDYHHHLCNNNLNLDIKDYIKDIFATWQKEKPKIHFSSPKSKLKKEFRSHHDYIDVSTFIKFINEIKFCDIDFDIMIEAKKKDEALFKLVRELKYLTNYQFIDETSFIV